MPTLDSEIEVPDYNLTLKYHSSRSPDEAMVKKICESLRLAREIADEAVAKLQAAFDDPESQDTLAHEVAQYHFKVYAESPAEAREKIITVMRDTAEGLKEDVTLSDVLNRYRWDLYKVYRDGRSWDEAQSELSGSFREITAEKYRGGYVLFKEWEDEFLDRTITRSEAKSIHIEFSDAAVYPRLQLARVIIHEATHKFAGTEDHAYTDFDEYKNLTRDQRIENADSFAYVAISLHLNRLIKDLAECFQVIPKNGPSD